MRDSVFSKQSGKSNSISAIQSRGYLVLRCDIIVMSTLQTVLAFYTVLYMFMSSEHFAGRNKYLFIQNTVARVLAADK